MDATRSTEESPPDRSFNSNCGFAFLRSKKRMLMIFHVYLFWTKDLRWVNAPYGVSFVVSLVASTTSPAFSQQPTAALDPKGWTPEKAAAGDKPKAKPRHLGIGPLFNGVSETPKKPGYRFPSVSNINEPRTGVSLLRGSITKSPRKINPVSPIQSYHWQIKHGTLEHGK